MKRESRYYVATKTHAGDVTVDIFDERWEYGKEFEKDRGAQRQYNLRSKEKSTYVKVDIGAVKSMLHGREATDMQAAEIIRTFLMRNQW